MLKTKAAKIAAAVCAAMAVLAVVLAAVFFTRPGAGEASFAETTVAENTMASQREQPARLAQPELEGILSAEPITTELAQTTLAAMLTSTQPQSTTIQTTLNSTTTQAPTTKHSQTTSATTESSSASATGTTQNAPLPVITSTTTTQMTCTISIRCDTLLEHMDKLKPLKVPYVPPDGVILSARTVAFTQGESVFDVLKRVTISAGIHREFVEMPVYGSAYIEGIGNIYELDCGPLSGWMYKVNGVFPDVGCSGYKLRQGDVVEMLYTCDLGRDIGGGGVTGQR